MGESGVVANAIVARIDDSEFTVHNFIANGVAALELPLFGATSGLRCNFVTERNTPSAGVIHQPCVATSRSSPMRVDRAVESRRTACIPLLI